MAARHLSYANVVATLALFVAVGGGAYAAVELPAGSVGTPQLRRAAVTPSKLRYATASVAGIAAGGGQTLSPSSPDCAPDSPCAFVAPTPDVVLSSADLGLPEAENILISGSVDLAPTDTAATANVYLQVTLDGRPLSGVQVVSVSGGSVIPIQALATHAASGRHVVAVLAAVSGDTAVAAGNVSLAAIALPPA